MKRITLTILAALLLAVPAMAIGQARIVFTVVAPDGKPIVGAKLHVTGTDQRGYDQTYETDKNGKVMIVFNDGSVPYDFALTADGYLPWKKTIRMHFMPLPNDEKVTLVPVPKASPVAAPAPEMRTAAMAYNEGVELANTGKNDEAIAKFEESVRLNPKLTAGYAALTRVYTRKSEWDKVIDNGQKALDLGGNDEAVLTLMAAAWEHKGDKAKADELRKKIPENAVSLFNKAVPLLNAGKDAKAEPILLKAIAKDDTFARAHYELGMIYLRKGKNAEARKELQRYLELDPNGKDAATAKEMLKYLK